MVVGVVMSFMIVGGVSFIFVVIVVWVLVKLCVFVVYFGFVLVGSFIVGIVW